MHTIRLEKKKAEYEFGTENRKQIKEQAEDEWKEEKIKSLMHHVYSVNIAPILFLPSR